MGRRCQNAYSELSGKMKRNLIRRAHVLICTYLKQSLESKWAVANEIQEKESMFRGPWILRQGALKGTLFKEIQMGYFSIKMEESWYMFRCYEWKS